MVKRIKPVFFSNTLHLQQYTCPTFNRLFETFWTSFVTVLLIMLVELFFHPQHLLDYRFPINKFFQPQKQEEIGWHERVGVLSCNTVLS